MKFRYGAVVALAVLVCAPQAFADDCKPLTLEASIDLVPAQDKSAEFAPVTLGTTNKLMLVDTGGFYSELTPDAVSELGLRTYTNFNFVQEDVTGKQATTLADVSPFKMGTLSSQTMSFVVAPSAALFGGGKDVAGAIGPNILRNYDADFDFGTNKLNLLSQDHCDGKVVYWPADAVAVVPVKVAGLGHIVLTVTLDGHQVSAMLDTGSSNTTLMRDVAEGTFGLKMGGADTPATGELPGLVGATIYTHKFASLALEGIAVGNVDVDIIPNLGGQKADIGSEVGTRLFDRDPHGDHTDMLLGMNVLRHLHVYIAYREQKLYITPASAPAPASQAGSASH